MKLQRVMVLRMWEEAGTFSETVIWSVSLILGSGDSINSGFRLVETEILTQFSN